MKNLVSIIIPTYNRAHLIGDTLDSILAQTYQNWECIIVDDGSTDDTEIVINRYIQNDARFRFYHRPATHLPGGNGARNYGYEMSSGDYIQWFDSDDIMLPNFLQEKLTVFTPSSKFVICTGYEVDHQLRDRTKFDLIDQSEITLFSQYVQWKLKIFTPSVLFKKSFLMGKFIFSETIVRGQETEFFSRLFFKLKAAEYVILNTPLFLYRMHSENKTAKNKSYNKIYKTSQTEINLKNFTRAVSLNDQQLTQYLYSSLMSLFFMANENNHSRNARLIVTKLSKQLYTLDVIKAITFLSLSYFYLYGYKTYFVRDYLKRLKIQL